MKSAGRTTQFLKHQIDALTGIRFFAAFAVLIFHSGAGFLVRMNFPLFITTLIQKGYMGVSLFFVLSGFILTFNYSDRIEDWKNWYSFGIARFARIYPVYLLSLMIAYPIVHNQLSVMQILKVLFMVQSYGRPSSSEGYLWVMQAWTISVEFFFYLIFPFLLNLVNRMSKHFLPPAIALTGFVIVFWGTSVIHPGLVENNIPSDWAWPLPILRVPEFILGILLCRWVREYPVSSKTFSNAIMTSLTLFFTLGVLEMGSSSRGIALTTILFGLLITQLSSGHNLVTSFFSNRVLVLLGGASYSIYILQGPIREWLRLLIPAPFDSFLNPLLVIGLSILVFLYFEEPAREQIKAFNQIFVNKFLNSTKGK